METYRVYVEKVIQDSDGDSAYTTVIELMAPREQLARFAPGVVAEALGANTMVRVDNSTATFTSTFQAENPAPTDIAAEIDSVTRDETGQVTTRRRRRTKAEMEAARAAEEAAEQARARELTRDADAATVVAETLVADGATAKAPEAPYNPFLQQGRG